jgi:hypothetical protein
MPGKLSSFPFIVFFFTVRILLSKTVPLVSVRDYQDISFFTILLHGTPPLIY